MPIDQRIATQIGSPGMQKNTDPLLTSHKPARYQLWFGGQCEEFGSATVKKAVDAQKPSEDKHAQATTGLWALLRPKTTAKGEGC